MSPVELKVWLGPFVLLAGINRYNGTGPTIEQIVSSIIVIMLWVPLLWPLNGLYYSSQ